MLKLESLRATILAAVPRYKNEPAQVIVMTGDDGQIISTGTDSLSHEMHYTALVWVLGLTEHPDTVLVPCLAWHKSQQPEQYDNPKNHVGAFKFHAQLLEDLQAIDLHLRLRCTERVLVTQDNSTGIVTAAHHAPEPLPLHAQNPYGRWQLDLLHPSGERQTLGQFEGEMPTRANRYLSALGIDLS